ncbi:uncharacterized protein V6R79_006691 [Siganus canaliculatus]
MHQTSWRAESGQTLEKRQGTDQEKEFLENVSEVVGDLVVTDGEFPCCQLPAYRL